ncbi:MAG: MFS transporter [Burkholderiales bacterium]|nr:MFS transporter [Burkholderiales bacterium]
MSAVPSVQRVAFDESSFRYHGWKVVALCFVMAMFVWGFGFYGHAVYLAELKRQRGLDSTFLAVASTGYYLFSAVLVAFMQDFLSRFGPRRCVLAGVVALVVSAALLGAAYTPIAVALAYLVMAVAWATMSVGAITAMLGPWFQQKRGLAVSLALTGASLGGAVIVPVMLALGVRYGFATALMIVAAVTVVVLVPLVWWWGERPAVVPVSSAAGAKDHGSKIDLLRSAAFWSFTGPFAVAQMMQVGFLMHQVAAMLPRLGTTGAALSVSVTAVSSVTGRLMLGFLIDRIAPRRVSAALVLSQAAALGVIAWMPPSQTTLLVACGVFGLSMGNLITLPSMVIQREFPAAAFGRIVTLSTAICQFAYALGPGLLGTVVVLTGGYRPALAIFTAVHALAGIALLRKPKGGGQR